MEDPIQNVSETAIWVAYYRAQENDHPKPLFRDPLARLLVDERAQKIAESMKSISAHTRNNVIVRTVIIDRFLNSLVAERGVNTVINLGAGLDTRPYRLALPPSLRWIEVDYPHMMDFKTRKLAGEVPRFRLERVSLDLADGEQRRQLFGKINSDSGKVLVLTEGVLPYLSQDQVAALAKDLHDQERFCYWVADYISPAIYKYFKTPQRTEKMRNAPFLFFPEDWFEFFESRGWHREHVEYIQEETLKLGRKMPMPWWSFLLRPFMTAKVREQFLRASGYMVMTRKT